MLTSGVISWVQATVMELFMLIIDTPIYAIAIVAINIFNSIARMDFFSTDAGAELFTSMTTRVYGILGIVMVFYFAYYLTRMIIDPDRKFEGKDIFKKVCVSFVLIALYPTMYHYMAVFQEHVLTEGTIFGIITGTSSGGDSSKGGKNVAAIIYLSMFHPVGGGYQSLVDSENMDVNGNIQVKTAEQCQSDSEASLKTCEEWINAVKNFADPGSGTGIGGYAGGITAFTMNHDLIETIYEDEGSEYYILIIAICGGVLAWFFFSYSLDLGYRTFKLGFLQIISPVPLTMKIFKKTESTYTKWNHHLWKTYVEVFVRVAIIAFIIVIIQCLPKVIGGLFMTLGMAGWSIPVALVALTFGLFKFGKDLPKLMGDMFQNLKEYTSDINWKPGVGNRISDGISSISDFNSNVVKKRLQSATKKAVNFSNLRGLKSALGAVGGVVSGFKGALKSAPQDQNAIGKAASAIGGAVKGGKAGWKQMFNNPKLVSNKEIGRVFSKVGGNALAAGSSVQISNGRDLLHGWVTSLLGDQADPSSAAISAAMSKASGKIKEFDDITGFAKKKEKIETEKGLAKKAYANGQVYIDPDGVAHEFKGGHKEIDAFFAKETEKARMECISKLSDSERREYLNSVGAIGSSLMREVLSSADEEKRRKVIEKITKNCDESIYAYADQINGDDHYTKIIKDNGEIDKKIARANEHLAATLADVEKAKKSSGVDQEGAISKLLREHDADIVKKIGEINSANSRGDASAVASLQMELTNLMDTKKAGLKNGTGAFDNAAIESLVDKIKTETQKATSAEVERLNSAKQSISLDEDMLSRIFAQASYDKNLTHDEAGAELSSNITKLIVDFTKNVNELNNHDFAVNSSTESKKEDKK